MRLASGIVGYFAYSVWVPFKTKCEDSRKYVIHQLNEQH